MAFANTKRVVKNLAEYGCSFNNFKYAVKTAFE